MTTMTVTIATTSSACFTTYLPTYLSAFYNLLSPPAWRDLMDVLDFDAHYRVAVCRHFCCAILPTHIPRHLRADER
jgi:hypothetical protein